MKASYEIIKETSYADSKCPDIPEDLCQLHSRGGRRIIKTGAQIGRAFFHEAKETMKQDKYSKEEPK